MKTRDQWQLQKQRRFSQHCYNRGRETRMELLYSVAPKAASTNENLLPQGWLLDQ